MKKAQYFGPLVEALNRRQMLRGAGGSCRSGRSRSRSWAIRGGGAIRGPRPNQRAVAGRRPRSRGFRHLETV